DSDESLQIFYSGSIRQVAKSLVPATPHVDFKIAKIKFVGQIGVGYPNLLANTQKRLIQSETGFYRDDGEIHRIWKCELNVHLSLLNFSFQPGIRNRGAGND